MGRLKPEEGDNTIAEYVGLCSKMYALRYQTLEGLEETVRKAKGVSHGALAKHALFKHYKAMPEAPYESTVTFRSMESRKHQVSVTERTWKMLSSVNDKVYVISKTESRPLGHWRNHQSSATGLRQRGQD